MAEPTPNSKLMWTREFGVEELRADTEPDHGHIQNIFKIEDNLV